MKLIPGNAQHIGLRQQQQDAFGFSNGADEAFGKHAGLLAVVADGMGGMAHGDLASKTAVKAFLDAYHAKAETEPIPDALLRCIEAANAAVYEAAGELGTAGDTGTTLIATVLHKNQLHWVSAGDSAIFLWRDDEFTLVNDTHVYAHELDARVWLGHITRELAQTHPEREALTSFLGLDRIPLVDRSLRPFTLQPGDVVLLASDGLFKTLSFLEMAECMDLEAQEMAEALTKRAIDAGREYQDNVTVVGIRVEPERPPVAAPLQVRPGSRVAPTERQAEPQRRIPAAPPRRSRLGVALLVAALALAAGYGYFLFSYDPAVQGASGAPQEPARTQAPGPGFDRDKTPPMERQPNQQPLPAADPVRHEEPGEPAPRKP